MKSKYVRKNSPGVEVKAGQNWKDLTPEQRRQFFAKHEQQWKNRENATGGMSHTLTKGK